MPEHTSTALLLRLAVTAVLLAALTQAMGASTKPTTPRCAALAKELATLESTMRAGYSGKAGEKLRDRQRAALDEFHRLRCMNL